ncbi:LOW QUALITY PROTEIN: hypothetical protein LguiA_002216 [Lonicera macranthoides]
MPKQRRQSTPRWTAGVETPKKGERAIARVEHMRDAWIGSYQIIRICTKSYKSPLLHYQCKNSEVGVLEGSRERKRKISTPLSDRLEDSSLKSSKPISKDFSLYAHENIKKRLEAYSPDEQNDLEIRNKIFEEVVSQDGHGQALCMVLGQLLSTQELHLFSDKNLEVEIAQIRKEAQEERICHKEELEQVLNKSKEYVNEILRRAGLSIPDDAIDTSS